MRSASFSVVGKDGDSADVSVVILRSDGGGALANVNRWRGQVGMPPLAENELGSQLSDLKTPNQLQFRMVEIYGKDAAILAAMMSLDDQTWFVKMTGASGHLKAEKPGFVTFLESITLK